MQENSLQLSPRKLKRFIKHLCLATKAIEERDQAKQQLSEHLKKLKTGKLSKSNLAKGIKELEKHIDNTIEKEKKAIKIHHHEPSHQERLREKMQELDSKLKSLTEFHIKRQERIQQLEKKITSKADPKQRIIKEVKDTIAKLEKKYEKLAKEHDAQDMEKIKEKINLLKSKLEKL